MKQTPLLLISLLMVLMGSMACQVETMIPDDQTAPTDSTALSNQPPDGRATRSIRIRVGSRTFTATLLTNPTVTAFRARLPITLSMIELNRNEKYADLLTPLPTNAVAPGTIQKGDLMLYQTRTLVLFYETFPTTYRYTKLGRVDHPEELATALGSGNVTVSFEPE